MLKGTTQCRVSYRDLTAHKLPWPAPLFLMSLFPSQRGGLLHPSSCFYAHFLLFTLSTPILDPFLYFGKIATASLLTCQPQTHLLNAGAWNLFAQSSACIPSRTRECTVFKEIWLISESYWIITIKLTL